MDIIKQHNNYLLVKEIGPYWNTRYAIYKKDFYYNNDLEKVDTFELMAYSNQLDRALEIFNKHIDKQKII